MIEYFKLKSTYDVVLEFSTNVRPIRIEILRSTVNSRKYRARVWDQHTYNLYPTYANMKNDGGIENKMWSCDEVDREITTIISDDPAELVYGKEWNSEDEFLLYLKDLVNRYHISLS